MKLSLRIAVLGFIGLVFASGCSVFPGLKVLSGQTDPDVVANNVVQTTGLVMGDKSGMTDPAMSAAADRIEAANSGNVDVIEIRKDLNSDVFTVYMLLKPPDQSMTQADYVNEIRRAVELTWQGTMTQSLGANLLKVVILNPGAVPTLDNGVSYVGVVSLDTQISRADAITYLNHRPNTINDFSNLIAQGKMTIDQPTSLELYQGTPNHSVFMLAALQAQQSGQSSDTTSNGGN